MSEKKECTQGRYSRKANACADCILGACASKLYPQLLEILCTRRSQDIQRQIRSLNLATDITRQKEFLARFKNYLISESLDMEDTQYRHFALQIALKCADLCNPCRPWAISQRWRYQVSQEFYHQGAYERQLRLPVTPTFDCSRTKVARIQAGCEIPQIKIDSTSISSESHPLSEKDSDDRMQLLSADSDIVLKQHRSKSDSGLTPGLLSPKIHMETYSTEELHPSTTLLSLSSITNTVQLRQVYAATKVESHLICPMVFQTLCTNMVTMEANSSEISCLATQTCDEVCSNNEEDKNDGHSSSSLNYIGHGRRRGSAPVTYSVSTEVGVSHVSSIGDIDSKGDLISGSETNYAAGRRWSIPMEISGCKKVSFGKTLTSYVSQNILTNTQEH
ncbi:cAMP-specific 3',5'-cyclic phosphodiesterase 7B [Trichonephila clavipes]|nr:cAMP-specific 3',5'-cyclic phosphodiesterase 7B [Trichonephila clavipes]